MSTTLTPIITQDGISALIDAKNRGVSARITHVAVGDGHGPYEATADMKALKNELQRAVVAGGEMRGKLQNQLYLNATIKDGGSHIPDVYPIYEMGFFLSDGTLFAIYASPQEKLAEKISGTDFVLAFDLSLTGVDVGEVRIDGDSHLQMPVARDNILVGDNTLKIHTQAAFDKVFNQGKDTVIADNTTIVLSPIQEVSKPFDSGYFRTLAPIERFTDSSAEPGKQVTCQASNHGLQAGDSIMIVRSSAYAGTYHVSQITDNSFDIKASFNADATEAVTALWAADDEDAHTAITGFAKTDAAPANEGTACVSNGHNLKVGDSILITGSDQYNGVYSLATIAEDQFIIDTPFIEADIALGAAGGKGNGEHHTFNGRPAYILKNSIQVGSNVSIIGFNPQDTVVVKNHAETKIKLLGTAETPITGVRFAGWSFDGRAGLSTLGGELITQGHGGGFFLRHVHHCVFHCTIVNHLTKGLGGGIYGDSDSVTSIRANAVISNSANSGKGVYGCHHSELRLYDCDAKNCNDTIVYQQAAQGEQHLVLAKETTAEVLQVTRHGHFMGTAQFDMPATFNKTLVADTAVVKTRLNAMQSLRIGPELIDAEQALIIAAQSGYNPVGITQASYGGTSTMELTTQDDAGKQATRICLRGGHNQTNIEFLRGAQGAEQVSMMINGETGFIGIGTSEPECPLDIRTYGNITTSHFGFLNTSKPTGKNSKKASRPYAIRTALRIAAAEFNALSDGRIKKIVNHSNRQMDLACLLKLKITDYRYIDEYQYGNEMKKGLIAQQVEAVFPQAVQRSSNVIPDIFSSSDKVEYSKDDSSLTIYLNQTVTLSVGDQVRLIDDHQGDVEKTVVAIAPDKKSFTVAHWQSPSERVFVYGKQVDDCRSVDYDRILMLCVSSVQAQQAEQQALAQENKHLHQRLALLEKQFAALQSQFKSQANCASADCVSEGG